MEISDNIEFSNTIIEPEKSTGKEEEHVGEIEELRDNFERVEISSAVEPELKNEDSGGEDEQLMEA
jgi:hypothetical protein